MTPVKQYAITELSAVSQPSSKNLELAFSNLPEPLLFHCGSSDTAKAIIAKLETSKAAAGEALEMVEATRSVASDGEDDYDTPAAEPKAVRWADSSANTPAASAGGESGKVMYDFEAQGDDELTVSENETVTVVDKENDEWWLVRNTNGQEGVVPAQYIEIGAASGGASGGYDSDDKRQKQEDEATAAASLEAERQREQQRKVEQRRAIERAAREKQAQEDHDRRLAEAIEAEEAEKRAMSAARRDEQVRQERESKAEKRYVWINKPNKADTDISGEKQRDEWSLQRSASDHLPRMSLLPLQTCQLEVMLLQLDLQTVIDPVSSLCILFMDCLTVRA
jgi:hypothetical protein